MKNRIQNIRKKLKDGKPTLGSWITLGHPAIAEIFADAGFDWLVIDLEHSSIDMSQAEHLIRTIDLKGLLPLVRLSSNDEVLIKRVLDSGAGGIVVPQMNDEHDALKAIHSAHYPPKGDRGVGLARAQGYGAKFKEYKDLSDEGFIIVGQIEHIDAVNVLPSILETDGLDAIILGPYDLSASMGIPGQFDNEEYIKIVDQIVTLAKSKNFPLGIHIIEPELTELEKRLSEGFQFIAYSLDIRILDFVSRQAIRKLAR